MEMITDLRQGKIHQGEPLIAESTISKTTFELHLSHVQDIKHIRIYVVDITQRKRAEEKMQQYIADLAKRNKELQDALARYQTIDRHAADMRILQKDKERHRILE